ncbi:MAG: type I polyketide synthase [Tolypothrix carrinoi HA7290-LM1]|jgi:myxalamid-type polyketide synthase MxaB|nr:type I polyketide synthase [Tolypothrix carrinoi HA7290-LM1]
MGDISDRIEKLSESQRLLLALKEARTKLEAVERSKTEPIAIIGIGCRFPGGADDPDAFWRLMRDGVDAMVEVPHDRWNINDFYDPDPDAQGKMYTRMGGFLQQQVDQFDPLFFGISPREAASIDPQQRLLLEVSWEALERAGIAPKSLVNSRTGVFVGIGQNDYAQLQLNSGNTHISAYDGTGNGFCFASGRLSYILGLQGPSVSMDTACSSSLVAIHLACKSLRTGECDMALTGGVQLMLSPGVNIFLSRSHALSPDGRCYTFDAAANGFARGEGCGVLVLKRLSDAEADRDNILAVIRGSAINHDGPSSGLTVPNGSAQQVLIRQALKNAKVEPSEINYVEAHGTATSLGDPIEVRALGTVLGEGRSPENPLVIGSVKTNMGHLEAAAGVAGVIKVVLSLQHNEIPPHLHFKHPSPYINWDELPVVVPKSPMPWFSGEKRRLAGVSSFGMSGTNAHIVLEEAPVLETVAVQVERPMHLLTLSAKTSEALKQLALRYENYLRANPLLAVEDMCFTANTGRTHFDYRLAVVAQSAVELYEQLGAFTRGETTTGLYSAQALSKHSKIAFLFTGQGSQYINMGRQLYEIAPVFRQTINRCDEILRPYLGESLLSILYPEVLSSSELDGEIQNPKLNQTAYTQPALFAIEYALFQLWKSWGIVPDAVMGHSVGEYVAATVAGVLSLEDGLKLIVARSQLMQSLPAGGEMVAVFASEESIRPITELEPDKVAIAAFNGPENTVISGEVQAVVSICASLEAAGITTKKLQTSHAFHSPLMEPILAQFREVAATVNYATPQIEFISNLTGEQLTSQEISPDYWCQHLRRPVQFAKSIKTLHAKGYEVFLEIGAKATLLGMGRNCLSEQVGVWLASLRPGQSDWQQMLQSLAQLYIRGTEVDWSGFDREYAHRRVVLPTYPFQRQRCWVETTNITHHQTQLSSISINAKKYHPLLGQRLHLPGSENIHFQSQISQDSPAYLKAHNIFGVVIVPATAYLEMAFAAGAAVFKSSNLVLENVEIQQVLMLPKDEGKTLQMLLTPQETYGYSFQIFSLTESQNEEKPIWTLHAIGKIKRDEAALLPESVDLTALQTQYPEEVSVAEFYQQFQAVGINFGPSFQAVVQIRKRQQEAIGQIRLPEVLHSEVAQYQLHPILLDASSQVIAGIFSRDERQNAYLPVSVERLRIYDRPNTHLLWSQVKILQAKGLEQQLLSADLSLLDPNGVVIAQVEGLTVRRTNSKVLQRMLQKENLGSWLYQVMWKPQPRQPQSSSVSPKQQSNWLIFADSTGIGTKLAKQLRAQGDSCVLAFVGSTYKQIASEHYELDPLALADFQRLLQDIGKDGESSLCGIVHLWSLESASNELSSGALQWAQSLGSGSVLHLVQALSMIQLSGLQHLWLVTKGAQLVGGASLVQVQQSPLWGLGKVITLEHPDLQCMCLDLDPVADDNISALVEELSSPDRENQIAYRQGLRYVPRLERYQSSETVQQGQVQIGVEPFELKISEYGILDNLTLVPLTRRQPGAGEVEIQVRETGLNFRDVLNALGMLKENIEQLGIKSTDDLPFGAECAGKIVAIGEGVTNFKVGDKVIAANAIGSFNSFVVVNANLVGHKPEGLSFEAAATIPIAFTTAHYGLRCLAKIKPGDRVLIHAAAGGVGQAAVQIAQAAGAQVFATASPSKWDFLKSMGVEYVMNSRTLDFAEEIMAITQGQGVDIVLNSLSGEFISKSFEVLGRGGRFVEIGKIGIWEHEQVQATRPDVSYFPFDLFNISMNEPKVIASMLQELMQEFQDGKLKPLPHKVFPLEEVVNAFRYMAQAKHIGKVVVSQPEIAANANHLEELVREDGSYLITGGLGALGLKVAHWLVEQGARHLILAGRRGASDRTVAAIQQLEQMGARVLVASADIAKQEDVAQLLHKVQATMPPLRGIIHAAGVLDDGVLQQQNWERFVRVMAPKVSGTWHLHNLTKELPLDFFVCFSSVAALFGSLGQGNYAAANTFMDVLMQHRRTMGLPGLSINWGSWSEVGMAASLASRHQASNSTLGLDSIAPEQGLQVLEQVLGQVTSQIGVVPVDWSVLGQQLSVRGQQPQLFFESFVKIELQEKTAHSSVPKSEILQQLKSAAVSDRHSLLTAYIQEEVAKILSLTNQLDVDKPLNNMGLDSLTALELRNWVQNNFGVDIPMVKFMEGLSVTSITTYVNEQLTKVQSTTEASVELAVTSNLNNWIEVEL